MKQPSPLAMGFFYSFFAVMFTYLASLHAGETVFNFWTILFVLIATFDLVTAIRCFYTYVRTKNK